MTTQTKPLTLSAVEPYRFTVAEYLAMGEAGILTDDDRVELPDGVIIAMAPLGNRHVAAVDILTRMMVTTVGTRAIVRVQGSIALHERSSPQPDLAALHERADFYASGAAGPEDALLLIEVAGGSVNYDRNVKLPAYARAGIPEVWLAVLPERTVAVHTEPADGKYAQVRTLRAGDILTPGRFPDIALAVAGIMPG